MLKSCVLEVAIGQETGSQNHAHIKAWSFKPKLLSISIFGLHRSLRKTRWNRKNLLAGTLPPTHTGVEAGSTPANRRVKHARCSVLSARVESCLFHARAHWRAALFMSSSIQRCTVASPHPSREPWAYASLLAPSSQDGYGTVPPRVRSTPVHLPSRRFTTLHNARRRCPSRRAASRLPLPRSQADQKTPGRVRFDPNAFEHGEGRF